MLSHTKYACLALYKCPWSCQLHARKQSSVRMLKHQLICSNIRTVLCLRARWHGISVRSSCLMLPFTRHAHRQQSSPSLRKCKTGVQACVCSPSVSRSSYSANQLQSIKVCHKILKQRVPGITANTKSDRTQLIEEDQAAHGGEMRMAGYPRMLQ